MFEVAQHVGAVCVVDNVKVATVEKEVFNDCFSNDLTMLAFLIHAFALSTGDKAKGLGEVDPVAIPVFDLRESTVA